MNNKVLFDNINNSIWDSIRKKELVNNINNSVVYSPVFKSIRYSLNDSVWESVRNSVDIPVWDSVMNLSRRINNKLKKSILEL
jgi:hypothetical protein